MSRKRTNEERNDGKLSRSVLESSGSCKGVADFNPHSAAKLSQGAMRGATEVNESEEKAIKRRKSAF
jgi:hypothetical protein